MVKNGTHRSFFSAQIEQTELERILQRIDENLALRPILREQHSANGKIVAGHQPPPLPSVPDLQGRLRMLRDMQSPLFVLKQNRLKNLVKRLLNLPLQVFGRRQARFNQELLNTVELMLTQIKGLHQHAEYHIQLSQVVTELQEATWVSQGQVQTLAEQQTDLHTRMTHIAAKQEQLAAELQNLQKRLQEVATDQQEQRCSMERVVADQQAQHDALDQLTAGQQGQHQWIEQVVADQQGMSEAIAQLAAGQQGQHQWIEQVAADQRGQHDSLEQLATSQQGQHQWIEQVIADQQGMSEAIAQLAAGQQGQHNWINLLQRKHEILALDLRERTGLDSERNQSIAEPQIVDPERYQEKLISMGDRIRVNLGCGEKPWPDYINVDFRKVPEVDVIADIRRLPFEQGSLAELASAHLVEHFRQHELRTRILPYWSSLLQPDGMLRIICPNWEAMLERLHDGRMALSDFRLLTFGAQDYEGDDHFAMYTPETLSQMLRDCGFAHIEVLTTDRINGICPEMEVLGSMSCESVY